MIRRRRTAGTSLVEILVVIVVFLIGILAVVQIFPGGFRLLGLTRNQSVSIQMARTTIEYLKTHGDQIPDMIVPSQFSYVGGDLVVIGDPTRTTNNLGPAADSLQNNGDLYSGPTNIGPYRLETGANTVTRIIGEGRIIPAPRPVSGAAGSFQYYGGLMTLLFGPALMNNSIKGNEALFAVYGNDLEVLAGLPPANPAPLPTDQPVTLNKVYCDQSTNSAATVYIPRDPVVDTRYRIAVTGYATSVGGSRAIEVLTSSVTVLAGGSATAPSYAPVPLSGPISAQLLPGETFTGIVFDSLQVGRMFDRLPKLNAFDANNPYQYKLIDDVNDGVTNANLGVILFNPAGYKYYVPATSGRRVPLTARVDYSVYNWGILRDELRIPSGPGENLRLSMGGLKVKGNDDTDGLKYQGLGFVIPNGSGGNQETDVVIQDAETGGIYAYNPAAPGDALQTAYHVDKSLGTIQFLDRNPISPELEVTLYDPITWAPVQIDDARGRAIRVFYQSTQEYHTQVLKAASRYVYVNAIPGSSEFTVGNSAVVDQATKIFFSWSDLGRKVNIGEAYYYDGTNIQGPVTFSGVVTAPRPTDSVQQPSIDVATTYDSNAVRLDASKYGFSVRYVRGASVAVRVLWNPARFALGPDPVANLKAYEKWAQQWRRSVTETYLQKGGQQ